MTSEAGGAARVTTPELRDARIEAIVREAVEARGPGVAVAVTRAGDVIHRAGYGLADLEWSIPIGTDTVLGLGSLTKPFTASAILLLERNGKLRLDEAVDAYLLGYPMHGARITLRHLLTHTSGIPNYVTLSGFWEAMARRDLTASELRTQFEALPLEFAPGSRYRYNNSGYHLLGMVVEAVSGMPFETFLHKRIFAPLGMWDTRMLAQTPVVARRARNYMRGADGGYEHAPFFSWTLTTANGGLASTLDDLLLWEAGLRAGRPLDVAALERMWTPLRLEDGAEAGRVEGYGLGWGLSTYRGRRVVHHAGGVPGYSSFFGHFVAEAVSIVVLSSLGGFDATGLAARIANVALDLSAPERGSVPVDTEATGRWAKHWVGRYTEQLTEVEVTAEGGRLRISGSWTGELVPASKSIWHAAERPDVEARFEEIDGGRRVTVVVPLYWFAAYSAGEDGGGSRRRTRRTQRESAHAT